MEKHVNHNMGDDHIIQTCLNSSAVVGAIMMQISYWMDGYGFLSGAAAYRLRPLWIYSLCMILADGDYCDFKLKLDAEPMPYWPPVFTQGKGYK